MKTIIILSLVLAASLIQAKNADPGFLSLLNSANQQVRGSYGPQSEYKDGDSFSEMTKEEMALHHSAIVFGKGAQHAEAYSVTISNTKPYTDCLQDGLIKAQVPAGMQSIYNPNTYVGKLFLEIKAGCAPMKVSEIHSLSNGVSETINGSASFSSEGATATGK